MMISDVLSLNCYKLGLKLGRKKSCKNKIGYPTFAAARKAVRELLRKHRRGLEPYFCSFCKQWHIGHQISQELSRKYKAELEETSLETLEEQAILEMLEDWKRKLS